MIQYHNLIVYKKLMTYLCLYRFHVHLFVFTSTELPTSLLSLIGIIVFTNILVVCYSILALVNLHFISKQNVLRKKLNLYPMHVFELYTALFMHVLTISLQDLYAYVRLLFGEKYYYFSHFLFQQTL